MSVQFPSPSNREINQITESDIYEIREINKKELIVAITAVGLVSCAMISLIHGGGGLFGTLFPLIQLGGALFLGYRLFTFMLHKQDLMDKLGIEEETREMQYRMDDLMQDYINQVQKTLENFKAFVTPIADKILEKRPPHPIHG